MKIEGGKIYELDPTKWYWLVINPASGISPRRILKRDGMILVDQTGMNNGLSIIENADRIKGTLLTNE